MPMEYRVRVKTERFEEPISRFISQDEEAAWEFAARESQPMNGEGFIEREIVYIEKQYVSGWQPLGLNSERKIHYTTQAITPEQFRSYVGDTVVNVAYRKALADAKADKPEIDWDNAIVKVTLEVIEE